MWETLLRLLFPKRKLRLLVETLMRALGLLRVRKTAKHLAEVGPGNFVVRGLSPFQTSTPPFRLGDDIPVAVAAVAASTTGATSVTASPALSADMKKRLNFFVVTCHG